MPEIRTDFDPVRRIRTIEIGGAPRNTTDRAFFASLSRFLEVVGASDEATGIVVRGEGRHFSSGADLDELRAMLASVPPGEVPEPLRRAQSALSALEALDGPTVAAIDGCCLGSGLEIALACRWRVATPSALLALPESSFGLVPGCGGSLRLRERCGLGPAVEIILSGRALDAAEALERGLVDAVVPRSRLAEAAIRLVGASGAGRA